MCSCAVPCSFVLSRQRSCLTQGLVAAWDLRTWIFAGLQSQARCWMAQDFPLSLQQLLPIMDVIGYANKYLKRVCLLLTVFSAQHRNILPQVTHSTCKAGTT
jgi:GPCR-chaperone